MSIKDQIINLSLSLTSDYTKHLIGNNVIAEVHSVYNKTINLLVKNSHIIALQPQNSYVSPVSLITHLTAEEFQQLQLVPKQIYQFHFNYQNCVIFHSKLTACTDITKQKLTFYSHIAREILLQTSTGGLRLLLQPTFEDLILSHTKQLLSQVDYFYYQQDEKNVAKALTKLIGLGIGLTPSGDDFLCGFISAFQYFNYTQTSIYQHLVKEIKQCLNNTNPISRQFLECALSNQFSIPILNFFHSLDSQQVNMKQLKVQFESIGHSSGMDTLFGIYYAIELLQNHKVL